MGLLLAVSGSQPVQRLRSAGVQRAPNCHLPLKSPSTSQGIFFLVWSAGYPEFYPPPILLRLVDRWEQALRCLGACCMAPARTRGTYCEVSHISSGASMYTHWH